MINPMIYSTMMYNPMSMTGAMHSANVPQYFQQRYGCGPEDFSTKPYVQPYPVAYTPIAKKAPIKEHWLYRLAQIFSH